jgi:MerR family transcriptional regulator, light-induced transcriptional regulator
MLARELQAQPPSLESYSDMPLYNTKAVVHRTGVPAPTLRAWERRYDILSPRRGENDYRLYSERDIATVTWLRERVAGGMTISHAIALLHAIEPAARNSWGGEHLDPTAMLHCSEFLPRATVNPAPVRLSLTELRTSLLCQLIQFDEYAANRTIGQALAVHRVEDVCLSLLTPTLYTMGDMWAGGEISTTVVHFASACIRAQLANIFRSAARDDSGPLVLVGCTPGELHELGALMLALFLRRRGLRVAYLGQNVEIHGLVATVLSTQPAAVLLSASLLAHFDTLREVGDFLSEQTATRPLFVFGGQIFSRNPDLARGVPGEFLTANADEAAREMRRRLSA